MNTATVLQPTKCRSCKAEIYFAHTKSGKDAPFERDPNGLYAIRNGEAVYVGMPDEQPKQLELGVKPAEPEPRFTSHFATCRQAKEWRKAR